MRTNKTNAPDMTPPFNNLKIPKAKHPRLV